MPVAGRSSPDLTPKVVGSILVLGALGTGIAYTLNYRLIADEGPVAASTVTYLLPLVAIVMGVAFADEPLAPRPLLGTVVVLLGVVLVQRRPSPRGTDTPASDRR
jgi:drug/metabolite transporter (DMT)-like permease